MERIKITIDKDGWYDEDIDEMLVKKGAGTYYLTIEKVDDLKNEADYRRVYFLFRDLLWDTDNRGYSKKEFHFVIKTHCLINIVGDSENYSCEPNTLSTKCLTMIGWKRFLDNVKEFAKNEFNIFL